MIKSLFVFLGMFLLIVATSFAVVEEEVNVAPADDVLLGETILTVEMNNFGETFDLIMGVEAPTENFHVYYRAYYFYQGELFPFAVHGTTSPQWGYKWIKGSASGLVSGLPVDEFDEGGYVYFFTCRLYTKAELYAADAVKTDVHYQGLLDDFFDTDPKYMCGFTEFTNKVEHLNWRVAKFGNPALSPLENAEEYPWVTNEIRRPIVTGSHNDCITADGSRIPRLAGWLQAYTTRTSEDNDNKGCQIVNIRCLSPPSNFEPEGTYYGHCGRPCANPLGGEPLFDGEKLQLVNPAKAPSCSTETFTCDEGVMVNKRNPYASIDRYTLTVDACSYKWGRGAPNPYQTTSPKGCFESGRDWTEDDVTTWSGSNFDTVSDAFYWQDNYERGPAKKMVVLPNDFRTGVCTKEIHATQSYSGSTVQFRCNIFSHSPKTLIDDKGIGKVSWLNWCVRYLPEEPIDGGTSSQGLSYTIDGSAFTNGDVIGSSVSYHDVTVLEGCSAVIRRDDVINEGCWSESATWKGYDWLIEFGGWEVLTGGTEMSGTLDTTGITQKLTIHTAFRDVNANVKKELTYTIN